MKRRIIRLFPAFALIAVLNGCAILGTPKPKKNVAQLLDTYAGVAHVINAEKAAGHIAPDTLKKIQAHDKAAWAALESAKVSAENGQPVPDAVLAAAAAAVAQLETDKAQIKPE